MRPFLRLLLLATVSVTACQPSNTDTPQPAEPISTTPALPTEAGQPIGAPVGQTIGPAGGILTLPLSTTSAEALTVSFPAGALSAATPVRVQLVENKAPGGIGPAIEVIPKDLNLQKPVTLSWQYGTGGLDGTGPAAVGLAHQRADGTWVGKTNVTANESGQTLTATRPAFDLKYPLAFYQNFYLKYDSNTLLTNQRQELFVAYQPNHSDELEDIERETLLAGLVPWKPVGYENLKNWRINGSDPVGANKTWGTLAVHNNGEKALFIAPDRIPSVNPAAISVDLKTGGRSRIMLVANIQVISPNRLISMGKPYENAKVGVSLSESGATYLYVSLQEVDPKEATYPAIASFQIKNFTGPGTYVIDKTFQDPKVTISGKESGQSGHNYSYGYTKAGQDVFSSGSITITEYSGRKGKLSGTFSATLYNYNKDRNLVKTNAFGGSFQTVIN